MAYIEARKKPVLYVLYGVPLVLYDAFPVKPSRTLRQLSIEALHRREIPEKDERDVNAVLSMPMYTVK